MTNFPLYENIRNDIKDVKELSKQEKDKLLQNIKTLDEHGHELIYVLIKVHFIKEENSYMVPYGIKSLKMGHRVDLNILPPILQLIIQNFVELHLKNKK